MRLLPRAPLVLIPLALGAGCARGASSDGTARASEPERGVEPAATASDASSASAASDASSASAASDARSDGGVGAPGPDAGAPTMDGADAGLVADAGPSPDACPDGMAKVGRACIDRWEAHLVVRDGSGATQPHPHNERLERGTTYVAVSAPDVFPQGYISRVEASAACKAAGKRLCSLGEWRRACRGKRGADFPWGPRGARGRCSSAKTHLLQQKFGADSRRWTYDDFNDPSLDVEPGFLTKTGGYPDCRSDGDVMDLVGNLHEWVSDTVTTELAERIEAEPVERHKQPWREGNGVFVGGFFSTDAELGPGCTNITIAHEPTYHDYSTGFRCCQSLPKPPKADAKGSAKAAGR